MQKNVHSSDVRNKTLETSKFTSTLINKFKCIHTMENNIAVKLKDLQMYVSMWVNLIKLNERSELQKNTYSLILFLQFTYMKKSIMFWDTYSHGKIKIKIKEIMNNI